MRLGHVQVFVAVLETGSMSSAARALGVSQPSVSKSVRTLESDLHVQLVQRTTRGVVPTRYGRVLFSRAKVVQSELSKAEQEIGDLAGLESGVVTFGCGPVVAEFLVPEGVVEFRKQYPLADIRIVEGFTNALVPRVRDESLDFAVGARLPDFERDSGIRFRPLFVHDRVVVGRRGHPLGRVKSLSKLAQAAWLTFEPRPLLDSIFSTHGIPTPKPVIECESYIGFLSLLQYTDMLGIVPRSILSKPATGDSLRILELSEKLPGRTVGLFTRADSPLTPAAAAMARGITAAGRKLARVRSAAASAS
jgi:LysR family transcriptional regulator, regulator of abg operon